MSVVNVQNGRYRVSFGCAAANKKSSNVRKLRKKERTMKKVNALQRTSTMSLYREGVLSFSASDQAIMDEKWPFCLKQQILASLKKHKFLEPTSVQKQTVSLFLQNGIATGGRLFMIGAETGCGKTLAYAIPIVQKLIDDENGCVLISTPTRELALQVKDVFLKLTCFTSLKSVALVGGISVVKQVRLLKRKPQIIVATPGRLHSLLFKEEDDGGLRKHLAKRLRYVVLDEADRLLLEDQHFEELKEILGLVCRWEKKNNIVFDKFVLSATLLLPPPPDSHHDDDVDDDHDAFNLLSGERTVINLTEASVVSVAKGIDEYRIQCKFEEKDYYLFQLLCSTGKGKRIVFVNSIDGVKRLTSLLSLLQMSPKALHAKMQQKQRLKSIESFSESSSNDVLIATDVAARGLDINGIELVIHYNVPRSKDLYIHRSGRTGRLSHTGKTITLVCPEEVITYRKLIGAMNRDTDMKEFGIDYKQLDVRVRRLVDVSRKIERIRHNVDMNCKNIDWFKRMGGQCDIDLDDNIIQKEDYCHDVWEKQRKELTRLWSEHKMLTRKFD